VPEFLRGGNRGETDAEVVFNVYLSFLHDAGLLGDGPVETPAILEALRSTLAVIDGMTAEVGAQDCRLNVMLANGDTVVAVHRSDAPMRLRVLSGKADAELVIGEDPHLRRKIPELGRVHFTIAASDFDGAVPNGRWKVVPDRAIVIMSRDEDPRVEPC
jgi:glutamine amidotransferase